MNFISTKDFDKSYVKLNKKIQSKFKERRDMFELDPTLKILNVHRLNGEYEGLSSINITADYRALFFKKEKDTIVFVDISTHSELFG